MINLAELRANYVPSYVKRVPDAVLAAVRKEAQKKNATIADTVLRALGDHYAMEVVVTGRHYQGDGAPTTSQLSFVVPEEMKTRIWTEARHRKTTESSIVVAVLAKRYKLKYEPVRRGRPPKT